MSPLKEKSVKIFLSSKLHSVFSCIVIFVILQSHWKQKSEEFREPLGFHVAFLLAMLELRRSKKAGEIFRHVQSETEIPRAMLPHSA